MKRFLQVTTLLALLPAMALAQAQIAATKRLTVEFDWVTVGDPGNPNDWTGDGAVHFVYRIATNEVTNGQYALFLNSKARFGDPLELFSPEMALDPRGGIDRTGVGTLLDPYVYVSRLDMAHKPVNFVSWFDGARFINWLANGQGASDTEDGTYTLLGGTPIPTNGETVLRNPGSRLWFPRKNQWYKAAYYDGSLGQYFDYGTHSNLTPQIAAATPTGDVANPGPNVANHTGGASWGGVTGHLTSVGTAGSTSYYGLFDASGNVWELTETIFDWQGSPYRMSRGGAFNQTEDACLASHFSIVKPWVESEGLGFRVAGRP